MQGWSPHNKDHCIARSTLGSPELTVVGLGNKGKVCRYLCYCESRCSGHFFIRASSQSPAVAPCRSQERILREVYEWIHILQKLLPLFHRQYPARNRGRFEQNHEFSVPWYLDNP